MAPKHHPTSLSGGDRKALQKELGRARAMTGILAARAAEARAKGEALIRQADKLLCESFNERLWADGGPIDPSPTVDQAINGGHPWLEIECSRCRTKRDVDLAALRHPPTTFVHDLAGRLRCSKCAKANRRPAARRKGDDLVYAGKVDRGFDKDSAAELRRRLEPLVRKTQPYAKRIAHKGVWVEPKLPAEIEYRAKSAEGKVRHPFFKGLRDDL